MRLSLTLSILFLFWAGQIEASLPTTRHIAVTGHGEVKVKPDLAVVSLDLAITDIELGNAKRRVDKIVADFLATCEALNIPEDDIEASQLFIWEETDYKTRESKGHRVRRLFTVKLQDISAINSFIDAAIAAGIKELTGIQFISSKGDEAKLRARGAAIEDAKKRASFMAAEVGSEIDKVYSIMDSEFPRGARAQTFAGAPIPNRRASYSEKLIIPRFIEFHDTVHMVFGLK